MFFAPTTDLRDTFLAAMREHEQHDGAADADGITLAELQDGALKAYIEGRREGTYPRPGVELMAQSTELWWCEQGPDGPEYIGRASIRHHLVPVLYDQGGQIRISVRPSRRRQGHGTAMLAAALTIASGHGLKEVMLVCPAGDVAARRMVEANGGEPAVEGERCWYRLSTAPLEQYA